MEYHSELRVEDFHSVEAFVLQYEKTSQWHSAATGGPVHPKILAKCFKKALASEAVPQGVKEMYNTIKGMGDDFDQIKSHATAYEKSVKATNGTLGLGVGAQRSG